MAKTANIGSWGEQLACEKLIADGCAIITRNWRMGHLEIDIVAMRGDRVIFCEVKTRSRADSGDPLDAIDARKMRHMARAADAFMRAKNWPHECQFDVIGIVGTPDNYRLEHIPDAFLPPLKTY